MNRLRLSLFALVAVAGLFTGCVAVSSTPSPAPAAVAGDPNLAVWDRLYFGKGIPSGGEVTEADWAKFLAEVVTPRFPSGLTVLRGEGQWRGEDGAIVQEKNFILEVNHADTDAANRAVEEIAMEYKRRFKQEAVLRMTGRVDGRLY